MPWMRDSGADAVLNEKSAGTMEPEADEDDLFDDFQSQIDTSVQIQDLRTATVAASDGRHIDEQTLLNLINAQGTLGHYAAWFALYTGADWYAASSALAAVESEKPEPTMHLLWKAICAAVAKNLAAIDELKSLVGSPDGLLLLDPLLRGLAGTDQLDKADQIIAEVGVLHKFAPWMLERLRAETRLDVKNDIVLRDAAERLATLTADESIPPVHRAEIWHNLGTAHDRLGERDVAITSFQRAVGLNPLLDAAREELERLQAPKPAPS